MNSRDDRKDDTENKPRANLGVQWILLVGLLSTVLLAGIVFGILFIRQTNTELDDSRQLNCSLQLGQLATAFREYYASHKSFPPDVVYDSAGKPMHSWRMLLLPYLDEDAAEVYDAYDFGQPWNSTHNRQAMSRVPQRVVDLFSCKSSQANQDSTEGFAHYLLLTGDQTLWPRNSTEATRTVSQLTDGVEETIFLVESKQSDILWYEPRDIDRQSFLNALDESAEASSCDTCPLSSHVSGINVVYFDGSLQTISRQADMESVAAKTTIGAND